ncbi:uncharacterized protein EV420DRAFT_219962 [Desarmillaria tabescens]|uniref:Uncharacterized protein n=1 Tax=Armillaria tabescens TaxID=1929756 RepID=A0AA39N7T1_ARMTA|nr:uncharacterized protein EV420DRAFT_219962 [Desarmillaria tabescens]KAK0460610.1 hypothetical protein EV420DRAFT_219962 [Desarmillaria tabescens]
MKPSRIQTCSQFRTSIPTQPFLVILVAMLCANLLPGRSVGSPPPDLLLVISDDHGERCRSDSESEYINGR